MKQTYGCERSPGNQEEEEREGAQARDRMEKESEGNREGRKTEVGHVLTFLEYSRSGSLSRSVLSPADAAPTL